MTQLAKVTKGMLCFGERRQRRSGLVYLADGKTECQDVRCEEGMIVKDIVDGVCNSLDPPIVPVVRPLLTLCDVKSGMALCHTQSLNRYQSNQQYQLKVFVNPGENSTSLRKYSSAARNYYFEQLKNDFVRGKLKQHMSSGTGLHLGAIHMVLDAKERDITIEEGNIVDHFKVFNFIPGYLKEQNAWKVTLDHLFNEYHSTLFDKDPEIIKGQYIQVYEKDSMCGFHQFSGKLSERKGVTLEAKISVSGKTGITIKSQIKKETFDFNELNSITCQLDDCSLTLVFQKVDNPVPQKNLIFKNLTELVTFCSVVDSYYHAKIDVNRCVLEGDLKPPNDPAYFGKEKKELCHGPISEEATIQVFQQSRPVEGNFLVRESRSRDKTFILSLYHEGGVKNYRISRDEDGRFALVDATGVSPVPRSVNSCYTLHDLINHHIHLRDGLPILLKDNSPPSKTGPIPLFPSANGSSHTASPDIPDPSSDTEDDSPSVQAVVNAGVLRIDYKKHIVLGNELGSGHFSSVYAADWNQPGKEPQKVAIKIPVFPKQAAEVHGMLDELIKEILTMYQLDHPNIVKLLGVTCTQHFLSQIGQFPMIVMEYIHGGSLRGQLDRYNKKLRSPPKDWQLLYLKFSIQIAEGMEYLGTKNVVHRDLATRNVLVVSDDQIKISDFGLARQYVEDRDYYKSKGGNDLPVYWYAPECLEKFVFSQASDVWSYGVTLWEIFTLGRRPQEFLESVVTKAQSERKPPLTALTIHFKVSNFRLPHFPNQCPAQIYTIMKQNCWHILPEKRLHFSDLVQRLKEEYQNMSQSLSTSPPTQ